MRLWARMIGRMIGMMVLAGLSGCASERHYIADIAWPFGNPNRPSNLSETADRALGHQVALPPLNAQTGNVWPGAAPPPPTIADVEKTMDEPLGQNYAPPLASPGMDFAAPGAVAPGASQPQASPGGADYTVPPGASATVVPPGR